MLEDTARRGIPPEQVAETIEQALTRAAHAARRYLVGRDAKAMLLAQARCCPDHVFDRIARARGARRLSRRRLRQPGGG